MDDQGKLLIECHIAGDGDETPLQMISAARLDYLLKLEAAAFALVLLLYDKVD